MGKPTICIGENKGADQLRSNCEADQRLCFRYSDGTIPLLLKSEISSFSLISVLVQVGLCRTCSETTLLVFPRGGSKNVDSSCTVLSDDTLSVSIMHGVFVQLPPIYGEGLNNGISVFSAMRYAPHPGDKTLLSAILFAIENIPRARIVMAKPRLFPYTGGGGGGAMKRLLPCTLARLSPILPHRWGTVVTNDWHITIMQFIDNHL